MVGGNGGLGMLAGTAWHTRGLPSSLRIGESQTSPIAARARQAPQNPDVHDQRGCAPPPCVRPRPAHLSPACAAGMGLLGNEYGGARSRVHPQSLAASKSREALAEDVVALRDQVTRLREEVVGGARE